MILQIYRETVTPGREAEYDALERDTARNAARLGCPNPYLAAESLRDPKVVWFFNAYDSADAQRRVAQSYMQNARLMAALARNNSQKAEFTADTSDTFANDRPESGATAWVPGEGRFLCITETRTANSARGAVFETADGTRFIVIACMTRADAEQAAGAHGHVLAVRPAWSLPAPAWIAADQEFWA